MSNLPENSIYGGPKSLSPWKRITLNHLSVKYKKGEPITMVTTYDYPSAVHVDGAGIDICLVGDSVGMVVHGHDTTLPVTLEDMILHCQAVSRGASRPLLVGDLPFGSYEQSKEQVLESAFALQDAGCFSVVLECVPSPVAAAVTSALQIPTIGIGAGANCSGQVLVYHDLLQMMQHPHHAKVTPKFCKPYGNIGAAINDALSKYREEVVSHKFPSADYNPYRIGESPNGSMEPY